MISRTKKFVVLVMLIFAICFNANCVLADEEKIETPEPTETTTQNETEEKSKYSLIVEDITKIKTAIENAENEDLEDKNGIKSLKVEAIDEDGSKTIIHLDPVFSATKFFYECK